MNERFLENLSVTQMHFSTVHNSADAWNSRRNTSAHNNRSEKTLVKAHASRLIFSLPGFTLDSIDRHAPLRSFRSDRRSSSINYPPSRLHTCRGILRVTNLFLSFLSFLLFPPVACKRTVLLLEESLQIALIRYIFRKIFERRRRFSYLCWSNDIPENNNLT